MSDQNLQPLSYGTVDVPRDRIPRPRVLLFIGIIGLSIDLFLNVSISRMTVLNDSSRFLDSFLLAQCIAIGLYIALGFWVVRYRPNFSFTAAFSLLATFLNPFLLAWFVAAIGAEGGQPDSALFFNADDSFSFQCRTDRRHPHSSPPARIEGPTYGDGRVDRRIHLASLSHFGVDRLDRAGEAFEPSALGVGIVPQL